MGVSGHCFIILIVDSFLNNVKIDMIDSDSEEEEQKRYHDTRDEFRIRQGDTIRIHYDATQNMLEFHNQTKNLTVTYQCILY